MFERIFDLIIPITGGSLAIIYSFLLAKKGINKKSRVLLIAGIITVSLSIIYLILNLT